MLHSTTAHLVPFINIIVYMYLIVDSPKASAGQRPNIRVTKVIVKTHAFPQVYSLPVGEFHSNIQICKVEITGP